jgi:hypothetical protein
MANRRTGEVLPNQKDATAGESQFDAAQKMSSAGDEYRPRLGVATGFFGEI